MKLNFKINKNKTLKVLHDPRCIFIIAGFIGAAFFVYFYGFYIINPLHVDWLLAGGDLKQHYAGWEFYRHTDWTFPIGMISELAYPFGLPVTYMDSIPLVAIPLKLISGVLPEQFQYFGLWGLACYILQGGFAALIMRRFTKNALVALLASVMFVLSPLVMMRMFGHTALASHWIILAAIWACLNWRVFGGVNRHVFVWSLILVVATLIHPYFIPMVGMFFAISLILSHQKWMSTSLKVFVPLTVSLFTFWVIGGFAVQGAAGGALGAYAFNLNSLINPFGWSQFLQALPTHPARTLEGFNYLGLGMLLLIPVSTYLVIQNIWPKFSISAIKKGFTIRHALIIGVFIAVLLFSLSPQIQLGSTVLLNIPLPKFIEQIWSIFRATGRIFWPIYYVLILLILGALLSLTKKKSSQYWLAIFLFIFVSIQFFDVRYSAQADLRHIAFRSISQETYQSELDLNKWSEQATGKQHLFLLDKDMIEFASANDIQSALRFTDVALGQKLTMNTGYYARAPFEKIIRLQENTKKALLEGSVDGSMLYITRDAQLISKLEAMQKYSIVELDNFTVIKQ